jgi:hypothetical protein
MEAAEFYASIKDFVKSLRRAGYSDVGVVEIVRQSFIKEVCDDAQQVIVPACCVVCAAPGSALCERCNDTLIQKLDEALYRESSQNP